MKGNFPACLKSVLEFEGGKSNHPSDPGGRTNMGIIQRVYDAYRKRAGKPPQSVYYITLAERDEIYRDQYWSPIRGDDWPLGLDLVTFDSGVNSGPVQGTKWSQRALGVSADGHTGNVTLATASALSIPLRITAIKRACANRMSMLQGLGTFRVFGKGWTRRVTTTEARAISMTGAKLDLQVATREAEKKATTARQTGGGAAAGTAASGGTAAAVPDPTQKWLFLALAIAAVITIGLAVYRHHIQSSRASAFKQEAARV